MTTDPLCEPGDVLVASSHPAVVELVALAPLIRAARQRDQRYARMAGDARSPAGRTMALLKQAKTTADLDALLDRWTAAHRLLDARTAALVARAVRSQFPDPEQVKRWLR